MGELYEEVRDLARRCLSLKFLVRPVYDVLPSPANLFTWEESGIPSCPLCAEKSTLRHIMSVCPCILGDERYRWRHELLPIQWTRQSVRATSGRRRSRFTSSKPTNVPTHSGCKIYSYLLSTDRDWQLRQLNVPEQITTYLVPDLILWSTETRQVYAEFWVD